MEWIRVTLVWILGSKQWSLKPAGPCPNIQAGKKLGKIAHVCTRGVVRWRNVTWDTPFPSPPVPIPALFTVFLADEEQKTKEFIPKAVPPTDKTKGALDFSLE